MTSLKEAALAWAAKGKPVFPCMPQKKRPYTRNGLHDATTDTMLIDEWWTQWPDAWIGMPTGKPSGIVATDLDLNPGIDGRDAWHDLQVMHGQCPDTLEVLTPSGGAHYWWRWPGFPIKNSASQLGPGVDIRGDGGYIIVPPSPGYEREAESQAAPAEMPQWLIDLTVARQELRTNTTPLPESKKPLLVDQLVGAILDGEPLHDSLRSMAAHMRATGASEYTTISVLTALMDRSQARTARPGDWQERRDDIGRLVRSAAQFEPPMEWERVENFVPFRDQLEIKPEELAHAQLAPRCIVENHSYADVAQLVAPGGVGKTTLILYELIHVILGRDIWGLKVVTPGWCLVVTAEDQRERLIARVRELMHALELSGADQAQVMHGLLIWDVSGRQMKLTQARDGNLELTYLADYLIDRFNDNPPQIVLFDPLVSFGVSEERVNSNEQALILAARRIVNGLNCCVRYIHHTGQASAREKAMDQYAGRGGSALADGTRMTSVLQTWSEEFKQRPPSEIKIDADSSLIMYGRPKLSYSPPNLPLIWVKRTGYSYEYWIEYKLAPEDELRAAVDQLERFLISQLNQGRYHTQRSLDSQCTTAMNMPRAKMRDALTELKVAHRVVEKYLPETLRQGGKQTYLHPTSYCAEEGGAVPAQLAQ